MVHPRTFVVLLSLASGVGVGGPALALPLWQVTNADVHLEGEGRADEYINNNPLPSVVQLNALRDALISGFQGLSYGQRYGFDAKDFSIVGGRESVVVASSKAKATIDGDGTQLVTIEWLIRASAESDALDGYDAESHARIEDPATGDHFFVELEVNPLSVPAGTAVIVYYSWDAATRGFNRIEPAGQLWSGAPAPLDYARMLGASLQIDGVEQLPGNFSFDIQPPVVGVDNTLKNQSGTITLTVPATLRVDIRGIAESGVFQTGGGFTGMEDAASALYFGKIRFNVGTPPIPTPEVPQTPAIDFSVDIAGDTELSAQPADGDEVFDPGDVYLWRSAALPPGGGNGYKNDADAFIGTDPFPVPGLPGGLLPPVCNGGPIGAVSWHHLDLDGHDALEFSLSLAQQLGNLPPYGYFDSACINGADYLLISFEDDGALPYTQCDVPSTTTASSGWTYGSGGARDEVMGLTLSTSFPAALLNFYPVASESQVHVSLTPDPPPGAEADDDDVDSLDAPRDVTACGYRYFGVDHEATHVDPFSGAALEPGAIYEVVPGGAPVKVIDPRLHLGLPSTVDLADFEFVWLENASLHGSPVQLALIFAVHPDDPTTIPDESAGLSPRRLYYSHLTGSSAPLFPGILPDPIDAVTSVTEEMTGLSFVPPLCQGDANNDGFVNFADVTSVLANFGNTYPAGVLNGPGDANHDGVINFGDVTTVLANFGMTCP
ncbi:MAG: hypothetical protein JNK58_04525 [Phycisphaerae bacterium]|nr:hypothetical protein [Phycisphaerae bacterium]